jgi:mono/diheme cytochrome c family protein
MLKRLLVTAIAATLSVSMAYADETLAKVTIPASRTMPSSGKQMYASYCAPCHGINGRGQGPAASALRTQPADLTTLSRNNRGKFPDTHIQTVLEFGAEIPAHGSLEMPVWGPILGKMNQASDQERLLRINNLSRYLDSIQAK